MNHSLFNPVSCKKFMHEFLTDKNYTLINECVRGLTACIHHRFRKPMFVIPFPD